MSISSTARAGRTPPDGHTPFRLVLTILCFLMLAPALLLGILWYVHMKYPKPQEDMMMFGGMQQAPPAPSWRRWLEPPRPPSQLRRQRSGKGEANVLREGVAGQGTVAGGMDPGHLALRELAESQTILVNQGERSEQDAWETFQQSSVRGPHREYEQKRLRSRMLLMKFADNEDDLAILREFREAAVEVVEMPLASFEEYYYAGVATLFSGEDNLAREYLTKALDQWPARGLGYANVYFFMLLAKGIEPDTPTFFRMIADFKETYPNWMYIETYMPDIEHLERVYPHAPLIRAARGYCYSLVYNDAAARAAYQQALAMSKLDHLGRQTINGWLSQLEDGPS